MNFCLRVFTLGMRFGLIALLARFLDVASVGHYGLFAAAIFYGLLVFGLDLYVFVNREIVRAKPNEISGLLKNQFLVICLGYLLLAPPVLYVLQQSNLPSDLLWWFLPVLLLEHFNQEVFRVLVVLERQLTASILLFVRQGSWVMILAVLFWLDPESRNLTLLFSLWLGAGILAAIGALVALRAVGLGRPDAGLKLQWVKAALLVSAIYLLATLALRAILTFDRFIMEELSGIEIVGVYVFFVGLAAALNALSDAAVFAFKYPQLLRLADPDPTAEFWRQSAFMALQAAIFAIVFVAGAVFVLPWILAWVSAPIYAQFAQLFYWALAAATLLSWSMVPHYILYSLNRDTLILSSHLIAMAIFFLSTYLISAQNSLYAVPISVVLAMATNLVAKSLASAYVYASLSKRNAAN
ncbi:lipopolysaccharide biosynthesis protein [Qipengyuania sp. DGS5-3]|uniref:lipopolysaccharide biosynthesis protein n=1 Tax=Qipengyuania sp. DGS5-3 TaxID=3349632 RepID=UPI0036D2CF6F